MHFRFIVILSILILTGSFQSKAQSYSEYEVKLVYLYQFVKYFNWPKEDDSQNEFIVGIYGNYDLGNLPDEMYEKRKFNNKACKVVYLNSAEDAKKCDLVYVLGIKKFETIQFFKALGNSPVLTVGDQLEEFCEIGGMINFTNKDDKQRLELSPTNVQKVGMQVSKQLYAIARIVDVDVDEF